MTGIAFVRDTIRLEFQCRLGDEQTCIGLCAEEGQEQRMCENLRAVVLAAAIGLAVVGLGAHRAIQAQLHALLEALTTLVP